MTLLMHRQRQRELAISYLLHLYVYRIVKLTHRYLLNCNQVYLNHCDLCQTNSIIKEIKKKNVTHEKETNIHNFNVLFSISIY